MNFNATQPIYLDEHELAKRWLDSDLRLSSVLQTMESVESWTKQGDPKVEAALSKLADDIEKYASTGTIGTLTQDFIVILAYAKTGRAMHMLSSLDQRYQGAGLKLVQSAVEMSKLEDFQSTEGRLMVERLEILRRIRSLNRIFSQSRLRFVIRALQEVNQDE